MSPNLAASIRARLLNAAKAQGVDFTIGCWCALPANACRRL